MASIVTSKSASVSVDGRLVATVDEVPTGGGTGSYFTPAGVLEEKTHPVGSVFHARLVSLDRSVPDEVHETPDFDAAVQLAERYAANVLERAESARAALAV